MKGKLPNGIDSAGTEQVSVKNQAAQIIASVCGVLAVLYVLGIPIKVDQCFIILLLMAFLPWLGFFIKKAGKEIELTDPLSGSTERAAFLIQTAPGGTAAKGFDGLTHEARVVLKTLVHYHRDFGIQADRRWVFTVPFGFDHHPKFVAGILELSKLSLVVSDASGRIGLSDEGVRFYEQNQQSIESFEPRFSFEPKKP